MVLNVDDLYLKHADSLQKWWGPLPLDPRPSYGHAVIIEIRLHGVSAMSGIVQLQLK